MSKVQRPPRVVPTVSNAEAEKYLRDRSKDEEFIQQFVNDPLDKISVTTKAQKELSPLNVDKKELGSHTQKKQWINSHGACKNDFVKLSGRYFATYEKLTVLRAQVRKMVREKVDSVSITSTTDDQKTEIVIDNGEFVNLIEAIDQAKTRIYKGNQLLFDLYGNAPKKANVSPEQKLDNNILHPRKANRVFAEFANKYLDVFKNGNDYLPGRTALKIIYAIFNDMRSGITKNKITSSQNSNRRRAPGTSYDVSGSDDFQDLLDNITVGNETLHDILQNRKGDLLDLKNFNASHLMTIQAYLDDPITDSAEVEEAKNSIKKNRKDFLELYNAGAVRVPARPSNRKR